MKAHLGIKMPSVRAQSKGAVGQFHTNLAAAGIDRNAVDVVIISFAFGLGAGSPRCWASAVHGGIARCLKNSDDGTAEVLRGRAGSGKWVRVFVRYTCLVLIRTLCRHALAKVQACPRTAACLGRPQGGLQWPKSWMIAATSLLT